jgi:hypothetical protein
MPLFTGAYPDPLAAAPHAGMQTALLTARSALSLVGTSNVDTLALIAVAITEPLRVQWRLGSAGWSSVRPAI